MKYNPTTKEKYTDEGQFNKKIGCPEKGENDLKRMRYICNKSVYLL